MPGTQKVRVHAHTHPPDRGKHRVLWVPTGGTQPGQECPRAQQGPVICPSGKSGTSKRQNGKKGKPGLLGTQKVPNKSYLPSPCRKFVTHRAHMPFMSKWLVEHFKAILAKSTFFFLLNLKIFVFIILYWSWSQRTYHCSVSIAEKAISFIALLADTTPDTRRSKLTGCLIQRKWEKRFAFPTKALGMRYTCESSGSFYSENCKFGAERRWK